MSDDLRPSRWEGIEETQAHIDQANMLVFAKYVLEQGFADGSEGTAWMTRRALQIVDDAGLKTSAEWQRLKPEVIVLDPDGWDRTAGNGKTSGYNYSWNIELIDEATYVKRVMRSTCKWATWGMGGQEAVHSYPTIIDGAILELTVPQWDQDLSYFKDKSESTD